MRSVDAATLLNGLNGTTSLAPIVGAFLSDAYLGRYLALAIASVASLIVSPSPSPRQLPPDPSIHHAPCMSLPSSRPLSWRIAGVHERETPLTGLRIGDRGRGSRRMSGRSVLPRFPFSGWSGLEIQLARACASGL